MGWTRTVLLKDHATTLNIPEGRKLNPTPNPGAKIRKHYDKPLNDHRQHVKTHEKLHGDFHKWPAVAVNCPVHTESQLGLGFIELKLPYALPKVCLNCTVQFIACTTITPKL